MKRNNNLKMVMNTKNLNFSYKTVKHFNENLKCPSDVLVKNMR